ncbi:MAG TPA: putative DNA-binding domain-containing protein [Parachlamydiaceae bacterium]|nr:putative DNA-binding domain-containing protein [Parachlamydiaceae bacterium]
MIFDSKVPSELKKIQKWFASIITRPLDEKNEIMPISPSGKPIVQEAKQFIIKSPSLKPFERIQIYNQQYWWRLLAILHDNFPLTVRLFGYYEFNQQIGFPYLTAYPPCHWSLNLLGKNLSKWMEESYKEEDKVLVSNAVLADYAYIDCFFAEQKKTADFASLVQNGEELCSLQLKLQPHVRLFEFPFDLFTFRTAMLKEDPNYWLEHKFPKLKKGKFHFILYRDHQNYGSVNFISPTEYQILKLLQKGTSIDAICEWVETQDKKIRKEAEKGMQNWFQQWGTLKILFSIK